MWIDLPQTRGRTEKWLLMAAQLMLSRPESLLR